MPSASLTTKLPTSPLLEAIRVPQTNQEGARNPEERIFSLPSYPPIFAGVSIPNFVMTTAKKVLIP